MKNRRHGWRGERSLARLLEVMPGFAGLLLRLKHVDCAGDTSFIARTDGVNVFYSESFFALPEEEQMGVMAHEGLHAGLQHSVRAALLMQRRKRYSPELGNIVMDAIINEAVEGALRLRLPFNHVSYKNIVARMKHLRDANRTAPSPDPLDQPVSKWSFEALYIYLERLLDEKGRLQDACSLFCASSTLDKSLQGDVIVCDDAEPRADGVGSGSFAKDGAGETRTGRINARMQAASRALQGASASGRGMGDIIVKLSGDLPRSRTPWQHILRVKTSRYLAASLETTWMRPSRRDVLEPGRARLKPRPSVGVCVDTSGSISDETIKLFAGEMVGISKRTGALMHVIMADDGVQDMITVQPGDPRGDLKKLVITGRGGTSFDEAIKEAMKHKPDVIVYLTDLYGPMPPEPTIPLIWAVPESINASPQANVGRIIQLDDL